VSPTLLRPAERYRGQLVHPAGAEAPGAASSGRWCSFRLMPTGPEIPEADALEQSQPVVPEPDEPDLVTAGTGAFEVPEADALDQAREVALEDDDRR